MRVAEPIIVVKYCPLFYLVPLQFTHSTRGLYCVNNDNSLSSGVLLLEA